MSMQELKTHIQLLTDVLALRRAIELMLNPSILVSLRNGDDVYRHLAPGGYEYTVAFLAILALGAAAVPLSE
jgi:acyl-CoA synthetase (AMP-forming)/AMP-acid ligase II